MNLRLRISAACLAFALAAPVAYAQELPHGGLKGDALNAFFRGEHITIHAPSDQPVALIDSHEVYGGVAIAGARYDWVLLQSGGHPCQYTLEFDDPQTTVEFNRSRLVAGPSGVTHPVWTATAQDEAGNILSKVGEARIASYADVPASRFTLTGPGIKRIVFWGDDRGVDGFCNVVIDTVNTTSPG
jgi:hypothetical protein